MIEYESKNKRFSLNLEKVKISIGTKSKIMNLSICQDRSSLIISTEKNSCMVFSFQDILFFPTVLKPPKEYPKLESKINDFINQAKKRNENPNQLLPKLILEMNPSKEEELSMAISLQKRVNLVQIVQNKSKEVNHGENSECKFIQWEDEFLICAFENRVIKVIKNCSYLKSFTNEDVITAMHIVHWQGFNLLVFGSNKKVKILYFYSLLDNEFQAFVITKLEGKIDIIESKDKYILFCSKENKIIYCYHFMNNHWKPKILFEINLFSFLELDPEQEIINVKLISNDGIIVSFRNKICLFYIKDNKYGINTIIKESQENISFSSLIYYRNNYHLIYSLQETIKIIQINKIQNDSSNSIYPIPSDIETRKKIIDTCINTLLNRKSDLTIKRLDSNSIQIQTEFALIKLEFNLNNLSLNFSLIKCLYNKDFLKKDIEEGIEKLNLNESEKISDYSNYNEYVTEKLIFLNKVITSDISESLTEESEIDKLKKEQFLQYYKTFKEWKEIAKKKIPIKNLFNEDDEFDLDNKIMTLSIKELLPDKKFNFDNLNIDNAFDFANSNHCLSNNTNKENENKEDLGIKEKAISDKAVIYKLNKESFKIYLDKINEKKKIQSKNIQILTDILAQIKYYFQEIVEQNSLNLIKLYRESILDILLSLESGLDFVFLFIIIIPISELIRKDLNKRTDNNYRRNSFKKYSSKISWSSDNDENEAINENEDKEDFFLNYESDENKIIQNTNSDIIQDINNNVNIVLDKNNFIDNNNTDKKRFYLSKRNIIENNAHFVRSNKKNLTNRLYKNKNNLSFYSNKYEKSLIETLTSNFCNTIIEYVGFFSEELKLLNVDSPDERLIEFFILANKFYESQDVYSEIYEITKVL